MTASLRHFICLSLCLLSSLVAVGSAGAEPSPELPGEVREAIAAAMERLRSTGDFERAEADLEAQFDRVIAFADIDDGRLFRDAAFAVRLVRQLGAVNAPAGLELLEYLREHETLSSTLVFLVRRGQEDPAEVYALLDRLRRQRSDRLETWATLAAAVCVVHDRPLRRSVNENHAEAADPLDIFDFYAANQQHMYFGIRTVPAELLLYVVDTTASIDEMAWALRNYRGDPMIGRRFFDVPYDTDHFRKGTPKKVTRAGWTLPNILRYGGVCADQAYFAVMVGKAIGVPTAYTRGRSGNVSHAWVGFLQAQGRRGWWNFDVGRYEEYQGVRGDVLDPQVRRRIPDSYVSLLAELIGSSAEDRQVAIAYADAARRLLELETLGLALRAGPGDGNEASARHVDVETMLDLVERGLRTCPGSLPGWEVLRDLAAADRLTLEQTQRWAQVLHRLCGRRYPDFYLSILGPMIEGVDEVEDQNVLWNRAFELFSDRADLAAAVRLQQGRMWEEAGERAKAGQCYEDVIARYANAGPFVIAALKAAERLLVDARDGGHVLALYAQAFREIRRPPDMAAPFYRQSNYFRVGTMYAQWLDRAGRGREAQAVRAQVGLGR